MKQIIKNNLRTLYIYAIASFLFMLPLTILALFNEIIYDTVIDNTVTERIEALLVVVFYVYIFYYLGAAFLVDLRNVRKNILSVGLGVPLSMWILLAALEPITSSESGVFFLELLYLPLLLLYTSGLAVSGAGLVLFFGWGSGSMFNWGFGEWVVIILFSLIPAASMFVGLINQKKIAVKRSERFVKELKKREK